MVTVLAFLVAIGVLITFHELGHYLVARWCGVKVLKFSFGFGPVLYAKRFGADQTVWQIAAIPLGGFVQMVDEREAAVDAKDLPRAFNRQSVYKRMAIVAAGPIANFLLAMALFATIAMMGQAEIKPVMGEPVPGSQAAHLQIQPFDEIVSVNGAPVEGLQDYSWKMIAQAGDANVAMELKNGPVTRTVYWDLSGIVLTDETTDINQHLGIELFYGYPVIASVEAGKPAALAGLKDGDRIVAVNGRFGVTPSALIEVIKQSADRAVTLIVKDETGATRQVSVIPRVFDVQNEKGEMERRAMVGSRIGLAPNIIWVKKGPIDGIVEGFDRMASITKMTLTGFSQVATGKAGREAISGPVTIADYAGKTLQMGWRVYLSFLAMISVSLGVLNLLPVPVLDGGHLMFYLLEMIRGKPLSDSMMMIGQKIGLLFILGLTALALTNDFLRLVQ